MDSASWVDIVGYQHEVVHTGVLAYLLNREDDDIGQKVAEALLRDEHVKALRHTQREGRVGPRTVADLLTEVDLESVGTVQLVVETKVDSMWSRDQLKRSGKGTARGILLAVGMSALVADQEDVEDLPVPWKVVNPEAWLATLRTVESALPQHLVAYVERVREEADAHANARMTVGGGGRVVSGFSHRGGTESAEHWAYFGALLQNEEHPEHWERSARVSGPLLTRYLYWAEGGEDAGVYVEVAGLGGGRRTMNVKAYVNQPVGRVPYVQAALGEALASTIDTSDLHVSRTVPAGSKTCTAASLDLDPRPARGHEQMTEVIRAVTEHDTGARALKAALQS